MNGKAKARRKIKSDILAKGKGEGRVITYEGLEVAWVKRAEKEVAKEAKGKVRRGQKSKSAPLETTNKGKLGRMCESTAQIDPEPDVSNMSLSTDGLQVAETGRISVARMW